MISQINVKSLKTARKSPSEIDRYIGNRMRLLRLARNISQIDVANYLGITFQQIQKFETGANRLSAGRLWKVCEILDTSPNYFYQGLIRHNPRKEAISGYHPVVEGGDNLFGAQDMEVVRLFRQIESPRIEKLALELLMQLGRVYRYEPKTK